MAQARARLVARPARTGAHRTLGIAIVGIAGVGLLLRVALVLRPLRVVDRLFVPDDTYYTLAIARSLAHGHGPTADGHTLTSGFQPLLGFLMVPVYWVTSSADRGLRADLLLLVLADTAIIVVLAWIAYRLAGAAAAVVAATVWAVSPVAIAMALGGLETSLAMLCEVLVVAAWIRMNDRPGTGRAAVCGVLAALAVLARIDAVLLVALLVGLQLWRGPRRSLLPLAGSAAVVLAPWWGWCLATFGSPIPASGRAAHGRLDTASFTPTAFARAFGAVSGGAFASWDWLRRRLEEHPGLGVVLFAAALVGLLTVAALWLRVGRSTGTREATTRVTAASLPVFAAGLLVFYAWFGVWWYDTRYLAPVALVSTLVFAVLLGAAWERRRSWSRPVVVAVAVVFVAAMAAALRTDAHQARATGVKTRRLDAATGYREVAVQVVAILPPGNRLGAWQSGALGYYGASRVEVVNLDGVVDPGAAAALRAHRGAAYIRRARVGWLAAWQSELVLFRFESRPPYPTLVHVRDVPQPAGYTFQVVRVGWPGPAGRA